MSLNASHNVSIHSFAKLSRLSVFPSAYASSINSTPPKLSLITSFVFNAVCPKYPAIKSARVTFLNLGRDDDAPADAPADDEDDDDAFFLSDIIEDSVMGADADDDDDDDAALLLLITPKLLYIRPIILATSVLPVPGEP